MRFNIVYLKTYLGEYYDISIVRMVMGLERVIY